MNTAHHMAGTPGVPVTLLENFSLIETGDIDEVCDMVSKSYCNHTLRRLSHVSSIDAKYCRVRLGTVSFNYLRYGADLAVEPDCFEKFFMLEIPLTGFSRIHYEDQEVISGARVGAMVSSQGVVKSEWNHDTGRLMVQINRSFMERLATNMLGHALTRPVEFQLSVDMSKGIGASIHDYVLHLAQQLTTNPSLRRYALVERQIENTLATMLLCGQPNNYSKEINAVAQPGSPSYVSRAFQYIMDNYREDISVDDLVSIANVSMRTLYAGFKRYKGVSPMLALKTRRLEAVREDLSDGENNGSVTDIACRWGFTHLGNFSHDYKKLFGELPSDTLRKRASL